MSITFYVAKETLELIDNNVLAVYRMMYPEGFDNTPIVDPEYPEYGALPPSNPWELNVTNSHGIEILRMLDLFDETAEDLTGHINPAILADRCQNAIGTINSIPEFDAGADTVEHQGETGPKFISCGLQPGYFVDRIGKLLELATIAREREEMICYA